MKISTQGRYGARILIDHATHDPEKPGMLEDVVRSREREINIKLNNRNMMGAYDTERLAALFIQDGVQFAGKVQAPDAVFRSQHLEGTQRRHPLTHLEDHPRRNTERLPQAGRRKRQKNSEFGPILRIIPAKSADWRILCVFHAHGAKSCKTI